ncbi:MAG: hypothetical protein SPL96_11180 [Bacteroidales bacterium]|nr:hypothetical protein [Bacteroidales bacterium]
MAEPTNQEEVKSKRDSLRERMLKRNPELNVEDPEAYSGGISDYLDELDGQIGRYRESEEKLTRMMNTDPRSAHFLSSWSNGDDPAVALMRMFGDEIREKMDDPEYQEQLAAANKEYVERVAKSKELEEQYQQNIGTSQETLEAFQQENGLSDEQVDQVMELLQGIFQDAIIGKFSRDSMEMALKAIRHDEDVAEAADVAEVKGRNTKINETLRKREKGDGVSSLSGANGKASQPKRTMNVFDLADAAK